MSIDELRKLAEALRDAEAHLDYCGYGDSWERECARDDKLPERIEEALELCRKYGIIA